MSLRFEQYRSLKATRELLRDISDPSFNMKAVTPIRERARYCLRHYPFLKEDGAPMFSQDEFLTDSEIAEKKERDRVAKQKEVEAIRQAAKLGREASEKLGGQKCPFEPGTLRIMIRATTLKDMLCAARAAQHCKGGC